MSTRMTGGITPSGDAWNVKPYGHIDLSDYKTSKYYGLIATVADRVAEDVSFAEEECTELAEAGEHPEWHVWEMVSDNARREVMNTMFKAGFVRYGTYDGNMHFEGTREGISKSRETCKTFAMNHGYGYKFEEVKPNV